MGCTVSDGGGGALLALSVTVGAEREGGLRGLPRLRTAGSEEDDVGTFSFEVLVVTVCAGAEKQEIQ